MTPKYVSILIKSWETLKIFQSAMSPLWIFRGQRDHELPLSTSFERLCKAKPSRFKIEKEMINSFKSRAHHYLHHIPDKDKNVEWLALLQHHGCPTRFLDFTKSFYIASFFALETSDKDAAVWAVNLSKLHQQMLKLPLLKDIPNNIYERRPFINDFVEYYLRNNVNGKFVLDVIPGVLGERVAIQQGVFLFPTNINVSFMENLLATYEITNLDIPVISDLVAISDFEDVIRSAEIIKFILKTDFHPDALFDLYKMNITAASLFPGLDGFARSLSLFLRTDMA